MRVLIKGGIWKNTEDEILKAAVMKYGKNQWARISSLLVRKTPKQCKSRWYEWLDPSIRKTEWSRDEDEKLLHLAKLMPTQWRTIAPIVGRTPAQCLERYQDLLDEAESKDNGIDRKGPTADQIRQLKPGEVDPQPENKPARPDPIDMDEDEKEMLSEARARLANTQGKKAKRKAREQQLEEARRMAQLQKRRELRAAGMDINIQKMIFGTNYNTEIPFHMQAPSGFYDVSDEQAREISNPKNLIGISRQELDGKRKSAEEISARKKDFKRHKEHKEQQKYIPKEALKALESAEFLRTDRKGLVLPAPQVSETDLEEIVKMGYAGETLKVMAGQQGYDSSKALLNEYNSVSMGTATRTPRLSASVDQVKIDAKNLRSLTLSQTPLLGEQIDIQGTVLFESATPLKSTVQTPNPMASHLTPRGAVGTAQTPNATPKLNYRDQMGINTPRFETGFEDTPRGVSKQQLAFQFSKLPKPKNDFEIILPELEDTEIENNEIVRDQEDVIAQQKLEQMLQEQRELDRLSRPVRQNLPRPHSFKLSAFSAPKEETLVDEMIRLEMKAIIIHDSINHPSIGQPPLDISQFPDHTYIELDDTYLEHAQLLIQEELSKSSIGTKETENLIKEIETLSTQYIFTKGTMMPLKDLKTKDHIELMKSELENNRTLMQKEAIKASKLEKKQCTLVGGYQSRNNKLVESFIKKQQTLLDLTAQLESFKKLKSAEDIAMPCRIESINEEVELLRRTERGLQNEYKELLDKRNEILLTRGEQ